MNTKRALISLHDTSNVDIYAGELVAMGWQVIATAETQGILTQKGITSTSLEAFTGTSEKYPFPPTLHPKIEECLTFDSNESIELVYIIPYPLPVGNDVGGRTLLGLAAKGQRIPVMSASDMGAVIDDLKKEGEISPSLRSHLISKANAEIARHYLSLIPPEALFDGYVGTFHYGLMNGENPYQVPAELFFWETDDPLSLQRYELVSGDTPCFTNMADIDCLSHTLCLMVSAFKLRYKKAPFITLASKHGNACGAGVSWTDPEEAVNRALFGNPQAVWGGEVICNFAVDERIANLLIGSRKREELYGDGKWMLDVVAAPSLSPEALRNLGIRRSRKVFKNESLYSAEVQPGRLSRNVRGGFLRQPAFSYVLDLDECELAGDTLTESRMDSLIIAWAVSWSASQGGNEAAIASGRKLLAAGGGPSTVDAAIVTVDRARRAGHNLEGSAFAANAFFPFTDAPEILVKAGCRAGLVPRGGVHEKAVREYLSRNEVTMVWLPPEYRGFSRH